MAHTYNEGDKVQLRKDLVLHGEYGGLDYTEDMAKFQGEELTICYVDGDGDYHLAEDPNEFYFTDEMLEPYIKPEPPLAPKERLPMKTLLIERPTTLELYIERIIVNDPATIVFYRVPHYNSATGEFVGWGNPKRVVAKCLDTDNFDVGKGVDVAIAKAYRKEIEKMLRKF